MSDFEITGTEDLWELSQELGRPIGTLIALSKGNDPFQAGTPSRRMAAEWIAGLWRRFDFQPGIHLRRIHYVLISRPDTPPVPRVMGVGGPQARNTMAYVNTLNCWHDLAEAVRDARYLGLIPFEAIDDRRSNGAVIHLFNTAQDADIKVPDSLMDPALQIGGLAAALPSPPDFQFTPAQIDQRYHIEIWAEKSTVDDVIVPLGQRFGINTLSGAGDISLTDCFKFVERVRDSGRPARILYVSDFDPSGFNMPVAVARKVEFLMRARKLDLDIHVRPVVLTHDQCVEYRLPRTPIKDGSNSKARFEERFGEGATELDALEAIHPGALAQILTAEIDRYYDHELDAEIESTAANVRTDLDSVRAEVLERRDVERAGIQAEYDRLTAEVNTEIEALRIRYGPRFAEIAEKLNSSHGITAQTLRDDAPDLAEIDWPEPSDGVEDDDPLFDSWREYVSQIDRYKEHQDRPITGNCRARTNPPLGRNGLKRGGTEAAEPTGGVS